MESTMPIVRRALAHTLEPAGPGSLLFSYDTVTQLFMMMTLRCLVKLRRCLVWSSKSGSVPSRRRRTTKWGYRMHRVDLAPMVSRARRTSQVFLICQSQRDFETRGLLSWGPIARRIETEVEVSSASVKLRGRSQIARSIRRVTREHTS